jgi:hypothetical protein
MSLPCKPQQETQALCRRMELDHGIATDQDDYVVRAVTAEFARPFEWMVPQPPAPL